MPLSAAEFAAGALVVALALLDVFSTILVPGAPRGRYRVARWLGRAVLPWFRAMSRRRPGAGARPGNSYAPLLFLLTSGSWLLMLLLGYGMTFHALAPLFAPRLDRFSQAIYVAGSSLATLGVSEVDAHGAARWLILLAAVSGFGVITAAVTFILQLQGALARREPLVIALAALAGSPPSGPVLLEQLAGLDRRDELPRLFDRWADWSADVLQSHLSYPALIFFHSPDSESDWLTALEAVVEAATAVAALTDEARGAAVLMHRLGSRTVAQLCGVFDLDPPREEADGQVTDALFDRLERAGYAVKADRRGAAHRYAELRGDHAGRFAALAGHLGAVRSRRPEP